MHTTVSHWAPVLTSDAGLSLTTLNWQEVNVGRAAYYLDALILKPGYALLEQLTDSQSYLNWPGEIILNASRLIANKEGIITIISPFDGRKIRMSYEQIISIINHLKPDVVVLPAPILRHYSNIDEQLSRNISVYIACDAFSSNEIPAHYGMAFALNAYTAEAKSLLDTYHNKNIYVYGDLSRTCIDALAQSGVKYIESNRPAQMGLDGLVDAEQGGIDLKDAQYSLDFNLLDSSCSCPTCAQQCTKAYLHHLILHTPLLAQRFLIQHNAFRLACVATD